MKREFKIFQMRSASIWCLLTMAFIIVMGVGGMNAVAMTGNPGVYTLDADFDQGTLVNLNHNAPNNDQLQLNSQATAFKFIWVAASGRGTIIKIDTATGNILGEYLSAPDGRLKNPSRTTVDGNGNVWTANRDEFIDNAGSAIKIGLKENSQCVDRNGNGIIDTSTGLGDIRPWTNAGGADDNGGVSTAEDECILVYQRLPNAPNARHVSVDINNDVWVAGYPFSPTIFYKLDGDTGAILDSFSSAAIGCGGYGGLIDANNVLWSAGLSEASLLRYDLSADTGSCIPIGFSYGLGLDTNGFIWNALWTQNVVAKLDPLGVVGGSFPTGGNCARGVVVTPADNDVWVANSCSNTVTRLGNDGTFKVSIPVGITPTGVAVDADGKVWVTDYDSHDVRRIDPTTNSVDLTVSLGSGAFPYNYSDMTGSTLIAPPNTGTWNVVHDSGIPNAVWGFVTWTADTPGNGSIQVFAASSTDGITFSPEVPVTDGIDLNVPDGQYLQVRVAFTRATTGESPILYDLTIVANRVPDCSMAHADPVCLWPPDKKMVSISVLGVTDPDGDPFILSISGITSDEATASEKGAGGPSHAPDASGVGTGTAMVRAERSGLKDGRVYEISFTATDTKGGTCSGTVKVKVPRDQSDKTCPAIDSGQNYDATIIN